MPYSAADVKAQLLAVTRWRAVWLPVALAAACGRPPAVADTTQREFWRALRDLCGQAFQGQLVETSPADSSLMGQVLTLDVWQCYAREIRLAFHVGDDHSRVWLLAPTATGLRLTHSLHSADGNELPFSGYGGETWTPGSRTLQEFRADEGTIARIPSAAGAVWMLEVRPNERIGYGLRSPTGDDFRVEFDLSRRAGRPPAPWGFTRARQPTGPDSASGDGG